LSAPRLVTAVVGADDDDDDTGAVAVPLDDVEP
jgi:hypothetical protein